MLRNRARAGPRGAPESRSKGPQASHCWAMKELGKVPSGMKIGHSTWWCGLTWRDLLQDPRKERLSDEVVQVGHGSMETWEQMGVTVTASFPS